MKRTLLVLASVLSGCIDLEAAYKECVDAGRCSRDAAVGDLGRDAGRPDAAADAGPLQDAGLTDAGSDGGGADAGPVDAGQLDAGPVTGYDGGPVCAGSTRRRLRCDAPLLVGSGESVSSAMASTSTGLLVARATASEVQVFEVFLDAGINPLMPPAPIVGAVQLAVDGQGPHWVAAWSSESDTAATCVTDALPQVSVLLPDAGALTSLAVGINAAGNVAVAAGATGLFGQWASHCPARLLPLDKDGPNGVGVAATADPAGGGFRFLSTAQINLYNGYFTVATVEADAGTTSFSVPSSPYAPQAVATVGTVSGRSVFTVVSSLDTNDVYELGAWSTSADNSQDGQVNYFSTSARWWAVGTCGPGCVMAGVMPAQGGPASVYFFAEDSSATLRGAFDAVCSAPASSSTISVASFGGRIGVLLTTAASAKLYLCDPPPLP
jgi:hypothetical protein